MADATLGTAVLRTKLDRSGLKTGLNQAKGDTQKFAADSSTAIRGIGAAFGAVVATQGVRSYVSFLRSTANLAHEATAAHTLFEKQLRRNNESIREGAALVDRLADRFGVANSVIESSTTLMLRQGASLSDVERALTAAGASAAASGFDISTAFNNVSTAVATGRSELLETSGIVANLGPVAQRYAKEIGKTVEELTQQELVQARVNAIYEETKTEIEDVDEILQGLPISQARVTQEWRTFREDIGGIAQEVIVPITQGLGTMLGHLNDLPEPVKRAGLAMSGAAIGATALATGVVAIRAALTGFQALGLLSFGPAGWIVLGVTAVAGLVAVLTGRKDSLDSAVKAASEAFNSGNADSLTGALDDVISKFDGDLKTSLIAAQDELRETGRVGVEAANNIVRALESVSAQQSLAQLGAGINFQPSMAALRQAGASMFGDRGIQNADELVRTALQAGDLEEALRIVNQAVRVLTEPASGNLADPIPAMSGATESLIEFAEELRAGLQRVQLAEFVPTVTAPPPASQPPPAGTATDPVHVSLDDIRGVNQGRRDEDEFPRSATGGNIRARFATPDEPTLNELVIANARRRFAAIDRALLTVSEEPIPPSLNERVIANARRRFAAIDRALPAALGVTDVVPPGASAVVPAAVSLTAPEVQAIVPAAVSLVAGLDAATAGLGDITEGSVNQLRDRIRSLEGIADNATDPAVRAGLLKLVLTLETELADLIRRSTPVALGITPTASLRAISVDQEAFNDSYRSIRDRDRDRGDGGLAEARRINEENQNAADQFANTVVSAGFAMGDAAIKAIADGDIPGLLRAGLSGAGSILGGSNLGSIGFLGGSIGIGSLVAGGLGILGTLIGAIFGSGQSDSDRAAAESRRVGNVPAINLNFNVSQSNTYNGAPSDPQNEQAFRRQADALFESLYRRHLGPRLDRIEQRLGIAGMGA